MIEIINNDQRLGEIGSEILRNSGENAIFMLTNRARWIKSKLEDNKVVSAQHLEFEKHLEKLANKYHNKIYSGYNAKILLLKNPMKKNATNTESIKLLIRVGADVKYLKSEITKYRLLISDNKLFFSYSDSDRDDLVR
jgi:spore coat polysaccharide biosynthesis protein SpsF (cytidylyltransferase family)